MKECIVVIVPRGEGSTVLSVAKEAGADWGVAFYGRSNSEMPIPLFGIPLDLPKEVLLVVCDTHKVQRVIARIRRQDVNGNILAFSVAIHKMFDMSAEVGRLTDLRSACALKKAQAEEGCVP